MDGATTGRVTGQALGRVALEESRGVERAQA